MNSKILQIALKICLLNEEYSKDEIASAISILEDNNLSTELLSYLSKRNSLKEKSEKQLKNKDEGQNKIQSIDKNKLKSLISLQDNNIDKYNVLSEFCTLVCEGSVLPTLSSMKRLGQSLSISFTASKNKQNTLETLINLLAERSLEEIKEIVNDVISQGSASNSDNGYFELAKFIIEGKNDGSLETKSQGEG